MATALKTGGDRSKTTSAIVRIMSVAGATLTVLIVAAVLAGCSGSGGDTAGTTTAPTGVNAVATTVGGSNTPTETTAAPRSDLPGIGDTVQDDQLAFTVTAIEQPGPTYNPDNSTLEIDEAAGTWFIVHATVENRGDSTQHFRSGDQRLIWNGDVIEGLFAGWNGTNAETMEPGMVIDDAVIMFDVPVDFPENGTGTIFEAHYWEYSDGVQVGF